LAKTQRFELEWRKPLRSWSESKLSSCNAYPNSSIPIFRRRLLKTTPLTTPAPTPYLASPPFCTPTAFPNSPLRESLLITTIGLSKPVATPSPPPQSTISAKVSFSLIHKPPLTSSIAPTAIIPSITSLSFRFALSSSRYLLYLILSLLAYSFVSQYTARFNADAVKNFLYSLNNGSIAKKKFNSKKFPVIDYSLIIVALNEFQLNIVILKIIFVCGRMVVSCD